MTSPVLNAKALRTLVEICGRVQPGEVVTIVTDWNKKLIAEQLAFICLEVGAEVLICNMIPRHYHGEEIPEAIQAAMCKSKVVYAPTTFSIAQTSARRAARESGVRFVNMPDYSEEVLQSPAFTLDFQANAPRVRDMAEALTRAENAKITSGEGTEFEVSLTGRKGRGSIGMALYPGDSASPPDVEAAIPPVEGTAKGILMIDASIPAQDLGLLDRPVRIEVEKGKITQISGGKEADRLAMILKSANAEEVYYIAELGIGMNPKAEMTGNMLTDEGCEGTIHIGIGSNWGMGGTLQAPLHLDLIMKKASLFLDGKKLIEKGLILLD